MDLTFITGTALFQGIREEELRLLLPCLQAREHMYQREEIILSAGNTVADIGLVLSGSVNIVLNFYWGSSHILGRVDQGSIFAENYAAIQGQELLCDVVAAEDTSVLFLNMNRLMTTCEKGCAFHQQLIRNMLRISDPQHAADFCAQKSGTLNPHDAHRSENHPRQGSVLSFGTGAGKRQPAFPDSI